MFETFCLQQLPFINACWNSLSVLCLALGYGFIRRGYQKAHRLMMLSALTASGLFLVGYLTRVFLGGTHVFPELGFVKTLYLTILISHMILAIVLVPMVMVTFYRAFAGQFAKHRLLARYTWPIWMYVSVTGVVVYYLLYIYAPLHAPPHSL